MQEMLKLIFQELYNGFRSATQTKGKFMSLIKLTSVLLLASGLLYSTANAADVASQNVPTLLSASQVIDNFDKTMTEAKKQCSLGMIFPTQMPSVQANKLYANFSLYKHDADKTKPAVTTCLLSANVSQTCVTARCAVMSMLVSNENQGTIDKTYVVLAAMGKLTKANKEVVTLNNKVTAYYTPGHAQGTWFPPMIEWSGKNTKYTLTWDRAEKWDAKALLVRLANSVQ